MLNAIRHPLARAVLLCAGALILAGPAPAQQTAGVTVLDPTPGATVLRISLDGYVTTPAPAAGAGFVELSIPGEGSLNVPGDPLVPQVSRSVVLPPDQDAQARLVSARWHDVIGVDLAPGRGPIPRTIEKSDVPYAFGASYARDAFFPAEPVSLHAPYIMRDVRGAVLAASVFQYNPVQHILRVYDEMVVRVEATGPATVNRLDLSGQPDRGDANFAELFRHHFVNYVPSKAITFSQSGDMLIISYGSFMASMQPLVDWKNANGIHTTMVDVATIGNSYTAIKSYITNAYNQGNLSYVLLVGDLAQIASGSFSGGLSDPSYSTITADWYPDILVGRFSATTTAQVDTQVQRSVEYEQNDHSLSAGGWNTRGMGIASDQGPGHFGEYDYQHMNNQRTDYLNYGFTSVDQIYDPTATKAMIKSGLENGRRLVNYCGHGSETSWGTTGYSNTDIAALTNDNLLPAIHSVACVNGAFSTTCFAEAWLRATHNGEPTGAVGTYMSSINQYWDEPMYAQDESTDLFCAESYWAMGALWYAGSCKMMDIMGSSGRDMFMTWHVFGDPSLRLLGYNACPQPTNFCTSSINSAGMAAVMGYGGSSSVGTNDLTLTVTGAVPGKTGIFFYGAGQASTPFGNGTLCLSSGGLGIFRLQPSLTVDASGNGSYLLDITQTAGAGQITAGSIWNFQFWYRDPTVGAGYNLSDGLQVTFCP